MLAAWKEGRGDSDHLMSKDVTLSGCLGEMQDKPTAVWRGDRSGEEQGDKA